MFCVLARSLNHVFAASLPSISMQVVRWARKPRWLPVAKSKLFRVPERKSQSADEKTELKRLHNNYKTYMRSLRLFLEEQLARQRATSTIDHYVLTPEQEEQEYQRCCTVNDKWNAEIAAVRKERLDNKHKRLVDRIEKQIEGEKLAEEKQLMHIEEIVRKEKELLRTSSITRDNLDEAIKHALANIVDYNFAIDLNENIYRRSSPTPTPYTKNDNITSSSQTIEID